MVNDINQYSYEKSRAERIIEQINASSAKKVALVMVLGFVCYHELLHLRYGEVTGNFILNNRCFVFVLKVVIPAVGCYLMDDTKPIKNGSPTVACYIIIAACRVFYDVFFFVFATIRIVFSDTRHCLRYIAFYGRETYFAFIGDSRIKELYLGFLSHLQQNDGNVSALLQTENNHSYSDDKLKIKVEFIWSANVSAQMIQQFR